MKGIVALAIAALASTPGVTTNELSIDLERMRNSKGVVHACLTRSARHFPDCRADPSALHQTVPAGSPNIRFTGYDSGSYALTLFHDENSNQRLDKVLGIPREGFGFSRNPAIRFGAPRFEEVVIELKPGFSRQSVRMQYLL